MLGSRLPARLERIRPALSGVSYDPNQRLLRRALLLTARSSAGGRIRGRGVKHQVDPQCHDSAIRHSEDLELAVASRRPHQGRGVSSFHPLSIDKFEAILELLDHLITGVRSLFRAWRLIIRM